MQVSVLFAFGYPIYGGSKDLNAIKDIIFQQPGMSLFASATMWTKLKNNLRLMEALRKGRFIFCDGVGTSIATKIQCGKFPPRLPGPDFMKFILESSPDQSMLFILRRKDGFEELINKFGITNASYFLCDHKEISDHDLCESVRLAKEQNPNPQIIWVCLGCPYQEYWALEATKFFPSSLIFPVGAAFDFNSGNKSRAPVFFQKLGLEWLYRLFKEPVRLFHRYTVGNLLLIFYSFLYFIQPQKFSKEDPLKSNALLSS
jgi:exopolysaccharide biosynthesis WecB/TagA/CpsF family protein